MRKSAFCLVVAPSCSLLVFSPPSASAARSRPASAKSSSQPDLDYTFALAAANRFLQAWQTGDMENGIVLLTSHAKEKITPDELEHFFSTSAPSAYEIVHGKQLRRGRYAFPVALFGPTPIKHRHPRHFSTIVVLNTGNRDWAIDKLP